MGYAAFNDQLFLAYSIQYPTPTPTIQFSGWDVTAARLHKGKILLHSTLFVPEMLTNWLNETPKWTQGMNQRFYQMSPDTYTQR